MPLDESLADLPDLPVLREDELLELAPLVEARERVVLDRGVDGAQQLDELARLLALLGQTRVVGSEDVGAFAFGMGALEVLLGPAVEAAAGDGRVRPD